MSSLIDLPGYLTTIALSLFVVFATFLYITFIRRDSRHVKYMKQFKGPPETPLLGNVPELARPSYELIEVFGKWVNIYGGCFRMWVGNRPYVVSAEAKSMEKILSSTVNIEKSRDYNLLQSWLGTGLLTSRGIKWSSRRKLLTPAFHFRILDDFLEVFNEQSHTLVDHLSSEFSDGKVKDIFPFITRCALDIICETAMGKKINAQNDRDSEYCRAIHIIGQLMISRFVRPWLQNEFLWHLIGQGREEKKYLKILHGFTNKVIEEKKSERRQRQSTSQSGSEATSNDDDIFMTKRKRLAFLDLLLEVSEEGKVLTDSDIREETDTFMFEGHDTTAANLVWTLFLLAFHPECQEKVQEELDGIFGEDRDREITMNDLSQMKYLELCIKESLRIYPSVPFIARHIVKDIVLDNNNIIPAGGQVFIISYFLHRDSTVFPEPEIFRPERFLNENKRNPYAYVPFSAGPRNCIGQKFAIMEEKVVLSKILINFILEAGEDAKDIVLVPDLILRPKDGIKLKLTKRPRD